MRAMKDYSVEWLADGRYRATFQDEVREFTKYQSAFQWAYMKWKRSTIRHLIGEPFLEWEEIAEVIGISKVRVEQIGLNAMIKIREKLLDDRCLVSLMEELGIETEDAKC